MEQVYRDTGSSALAQRCDFLAAQLDALTGKPRGARTGFSLQPWASAATTASSNFALLADRLSASADEPFQTRVQTGLRVLAASARASRGALYCVRRGGVPRLLATLDAKPVSSTLERWSAERLERERDLEDQLTLAEAEPPPTRDDSPTTFREDSITYRVFVRARPGALDSDVFGLVALGSESSTPQTNSAAVLKLISQHFHEAFDEAHSADPRALAGL
jgi:hypothetical protein